MNKNKTIILILMLALSSSLLFAQFSGGSGTEASPYRISSEEDLRTFSQLIRLDSLDDFGENVTWSYGKYFILTNNIKKYDDFLLGYFRGNFNGRNYKTTVGQASSSFDFSSGLFLWVYDCKISNLIVDIADFSDIGYQASNIGVVNHAYDGAIIENCINIAVFTRFASLAGGIAKTVFGNNAQIKNCMNIGKIKHTGIYSGNFSYGGIVGGVEPNAFCIIENCVNYGSIIEINDGVYSNVAIGGIAGRSGGGQIRNCVNIGFMFTNYGQIGGIVGEEN